MHLSKPLPLVKRRETDSKTCGEEFFLFLFLMIESEIIPGLKYFSRDYGNSLQLPTAVTQRRIQNFVLGLYDNLMVRSALPSLAHKST